MISIGARVAVVVLALALSGSDGFAFGPKPDLGVAILAAGSDMRPVTAPGQPFSFRIGLNNMKGAADAHHVKLTVGLPRGLKFQSSVPPPASLDSGNNPVWEIDTLPARALPRLFEVTAETENDLPPGRQLEISAAAECSEGNAISTNNHARYTIYVQSIGPALVFLGSTFDSVPLTTDGPATFKVDLRNAGNLPATDARLQATLPKEVKFDKADPQPESSSGQVVTFKLGDMARGESRSVTMIVEFVPRQIPDVLKRNRPLTFGFEVSGAGSGGKVTHSHFAITKHSETAGHNVAVWVTAEGAKVPGEVSPQTDVSCVINFANLGNQLAHKVALALNLGSGLALAHSDPQPSGTAANNDYPGGVAHWDLGDLGVGMSGTIRSVIHATSIPDDGALVNATIAADGVDIDASNNTVSLIWHSPLPPGTFKSAQSPRTVEKPVIVPEGLSARPPSHRWRNLLLLILLIVVVVIVIRARRS